MSDFDSKYVDLIFFVNLQDFFEILQSTLVSKKRFAKGHFYCKV